MISRVLSKYFKINYIFILLIINTLKTIELWSFQLLIRIIHVIVIFFTWYGISHIKDTLSIKKQIKEMEELFDKNGGFFWSNQQY